MSLYNITVNENQLRLIQEALDLHSRVLLGQFEEVGSIAIMHNVNMLGPDNTKATKEYETHHTFTNSVRALKPMLGFHQNGSYGIFSKEVHDSARVGYDIIQVIRKHLAEKYYKEGDSRMGVHFDVPDKTSTQELPRITENKGLLSSLI